MDILFTHALFLEQAGAPLREDICVGVSGGTVVFAAPEPPETAIPPAPEMCPSTASFPVMWTDGASIVTAPLLRVVVPLTVATVFPPTVAVRFFGVSTRIPSRFRTTFWP